MPSPEEMERFAAEGKMVLRTEDLVKKYGQRTVANHVSVSYTHLTLPTTPYV